jgi:peptide/nickel transport system permease protein
LSTYVLHRLAIAVPTLLVISLILFTLLHLAPGGPLAMYAANAQADPAQLEELERRLGLRDPLPVQYGKWLFGMATGDWGRSYKYAREVNGVIGERLGPSLELMGAALVIALVLSVPFGVLSAVSRSRLVQYGTSLLSMLGLSMPTFWLGMMILLFLSVRLRIIPSGGMGPPGQDVGVLERLHYLIAPAFVLSTLEIASWSRYIRSSMLEVLGQDFVSGGAVGGVRPRAPKRPAAADHADRAPGRPASGGSRHHRGRLRLAGHGPPTQRVAGRARLSGRDGKLHDHGGARHPR